VFGTARSSAAASRHKQRVALSYELIRVRTDSISARAPRRASAALCTSRARHTHSRAARERFLFSTSARRVPRMLAGARRAAATPRSACDPGAHAAQPRATLHAHACAQPPLFREMSFCAGGTCHAAPSPRLTRPLAVRACRLRHTADAPPWCRGKRRVRAHTQRGGLSRAPPPTHTRKRGRCVRARRRGAAQHSGSSVPLGRAMRSCAPRTLACRHRDVRSWAPARRALSTSFVRADLWRQPPLVINMRVSESLPLSAAPPQVTPALQRAAAWPCCCSSAAPRARSPPRRTTPRRRRAPGSLSRATSPSTKTAPPRALC
jgi:hypothetical protein